MKKFKIIVTQLVENEELCHDDIETDPSGEYEYTAKNEDEALDQFHLEIPIACLDDYDIDCVEA